MLLPAMLEWYLQAYRGQSAAFDVPIPFASSAAALHTASAILLQQSYDVVRIYNVLYPDVRVDLTVPCGAPERVIAELELKRQAAIERAALGARGGNRSTNN